MTNKGAWGVIITIIVASIGVLIFLSGKIIIKENPSFADKVGLSAHVEEEEDNSLAESVASGVEHSDMYISNADDLVMQAEPEMKEDEVEDVTETDANDDSTKQNTADYWVLNINEFSRKIHYPSCEYAAKISPNNYSTSNLSVSELEGMGYSPCKMCFK